MRAVVVVARASHRRKLSPQPGQSTSSDPSSDSWMGLWQWGQRMRYPGPSGGVSVPGTAGAEDDSRGLVLPRGSAFMP
jgi:hypothetical protein